MESICLAQENWKVQCVDFSPRDQTESKIRWALQKLQQRSPFDSFIQAHLKKTDEGYFCSCTVKSVAEKFLAEEQGATPSEALKKCTDIINGQLVAWKSQRFAQTSAPTPS